MVVDDKRIADAVAFLLFVMGHDVHTAYGTPRTLDTFSPGRPT